MCFGKEDIYKVGDGAVAVLETNTVLVATMNPKLSGIDSSRKWLQKDKRYQQLGYGQIHSKRPSFTCDDQEAKDIGMRRLKDHLLINVEGQNGLVCGCGVVWI